MNRARRRVVVAFAAAMAGGGALHACAQSRQTRVPGEYLVTIASGAEENAITDLYGRLGIRAIKPVGNRVFLVTLTDDPGLATMQKLREGSRHITAVQPNYSYRIPK